MKLNRLVIFLIGFVPALVLTLIGKAETGVLVGAWCAGILPGDVLCVDRSIDFFDGAVVIASVDGEFTVKYLRKKGEQIYLQAANRKYKPIFFGAEQDVRCWGVVTGLVRKFNYSAKRQTIEQTASIPERPPVQPVTFRIGDGRRRQRYEQDLSGEGKGKA